MNTTIEETTPAAPAQQGQDAADAAGQGIAAPDTAERLAAARQGHADALANHTQATERATRAAGQHRDAEAARQGLLNRAARGEAIEPVELTRAGTAVAEARDAADLASAIAAGAQAIAENAHIEVMHREGEHFQATHAAALAKQIAAAEGIDRAYAALQDAIAQHDDARLHVMAAANACRMHQQTIVTAAVTNSTLAKMQPHERPRINLPETPTVKPVRISFVTEGFGEVLIVKPYSIASALRAAHGIPAPKAGT